MRNGDFQATREEQLIPCSREIKEQFPSLPGGAWRRLGGLCAWGIVSVGGERGAGGIRKRLPRCEPRDQGGTAGGSEREGWH